MSSLYDMGITVFASELDCLADAPLFYRNLMHYLHFVTIPLYLLSLYILIFKTPISLRKYSKYLIWHTVGNFLTEFYISILYLPVLYSPQLILRGTGLLKYLNINGVLQFWMVTCTAIHTGSSITELFKYRFDATHPENSTNKKFIHRMVYFTRIISVLAVVLCLSWTSFRVEEQQRRKQFLWETNRDLPIQVLCYTSVATAKFNEPVLPIIMVLMVTDFLTISTIVPYMTYSVLRKLKHMSKDMSKRTVALHKSLLISLFIQALIHLILLGIPVAGFVYLMVSKSQNNYIGYFSFFFGAFHGSISTIGMIFFTKPIRVGVVKLVRKCYSPLYQHKRTTTVSIQLPTESVSGYSKKSAAISRA